MIEMLENIASVKAGYSFRGSIKHAPSGDTRALQMRDVSLGAQPNWETLPLVQMPSGRSSSMIQDNDILLVMRGGNYFAVHLPLVPFECVAASHFFIIRVQSNNILAEFLTWQLNFGPAQTYFLQNEMGSSQRSLRRIDVGKIPLIVPPLPKQSLYVGAYKNYMGQQNILQAILDKNTALQNSLAQILHKQNKG